MLRFLCSRASGTPAIIEQSSSVLREPLFGDTRECYKWWEDQGLFRMQCKPDHEPFVMLMPPPNVTGVLHLGHALTTLMQDSMIRYQRMRGRPTCWLPGTDHAGIATQSVVERQLWQNDKVTKHQIGREVFTKHVWEWKNLKGDSILNQLRELGASADWSQLYFTLDETRSDAVRHAFIQLYENNLLYRDTRLVHWCFQLGTALSDLEVEHTEVKGRTLISIPRRTKSGSTNDKINVEVGVMHLFDYVLAEDNSKRLTVATTRIETMLGDVAIAIHPQDERYKEFHGKRVIHPFRKGETIPIVCDEILVNPEMGTGVVKITPAHDPNDFECAVRHKLPLIDLWSPTGNLRREICPDDLIFHNIDRFDLRNRIIQRLKNMDLYKEALSCATSIPRCSRTGDIIEPRLLPQWFVRCKDLAAAALALVENKEIEIKPPEHFASWYRWLSQCQDWCISRQLWWGHRIPAYKLTLPSQPLFEKWIVAKDFDEASLKAVHFLKSLNLPFSDFALVQDEDVLDTWFSSALLPLSSNGWTQGAGKAFPSGYPLQVLETGADILFFWVARMVMLCTYLVGVPPFKIIWLHGMVRDSQGRKMSKSLGNVIDPMYIIHGVSLERMIAEMNSGNLSVAERSKSEEYLRKEYPDGIPAYGADALRFALASSSHQIHFINLDMKLVKCGSLLVNKLRNATWFCLDQFKKFAFESKVPVNKSSADFKAVLLHDWFMAKVQDSQAQCIAGFENYQLYESCQKATNLFQKEFCDRLIEFCKPSLNIEQKITQETAHCLLSTLFVGLECVLRLLHPFMPFITEELWQMLKPWRVQSLQSIMIAPFSLPLPSFDENALMTLSVVFNALHVGRSLSQTLGVSNARKLDYVIGSDQHEVMKSFEFELKSLLPSESISFVPCNEIVKCVIRRPFDDHSWIGLPLGVHKFTNEDFAIAHSVMSKRREKLEKEKLVVHRGLRQLEGAKLNGSSQPHLSLLSANLDKRLLEIESELREIVDQIGLWSKNGFL